MPGEVGVAASNCELPGKHRRAHKLADFTLV